MLKAKACLLCKVKAVLDRSLDYSQKFLGIEIHAACHAELADSAHACALMLPCTDIHSDIQHTFVAAAVS